MKEKLDVVIQGPYNDYTDSTVDSYLNIPFVNNVIVSCWEDNKLPNERRRVKSIRNKYPLSPGTDNKNLQIVSSLNGLKECQTNFSIKTRSDQRFTYDSMMSMYDFFFENNQKEISYQHNPQKPYNRILVAAAYPSLLFTIRDHIFWGNTEDLIDLFDIPLEFNSLIDKVRISKDQLYNYRQFFIRTETYIGAHYCSKFNDEIIRLLILPEDHLHDDCKYWYYSYDLSNITKSVFKAFSKTNIDLEWERYKSNGNEEIHKKFLEHYVNHRACFWHEEGY